MKVFRSVSNQKVYSLGLSMPKIKGTSKYSFWCSYGFKSISFSWGENL